MTPMEFDLTSLIPKVGHVVVFAVGFGLIATAAILSLKSFLR